MIDDDRDTNYLSELLLKQSGLVDEYRFESSAKSALEYLEKESSAPDCIFVDLVMPTMNGYEFVEKYEQELWHRFPSSNIFILTSSDRIDDQKKVREFASIKEYIRKPLTRQKLAHISKEL